MFHSINAFPTLKNIDQLTSSIRSDKAEGGLKIPQNLSPQSSLKRLDGPSQISPNNIKQSYIPQVSSLNTPNQ